METNVLDLPRATLAERARDAIAADLAEPYTAIGEYRPAYNGHTNRETWSASLWIGNDPSTYEPAREIVRAALGRDPLASIRAYEPDRTAAADLAADPAGIRRAQLRRAGDALAEWWRDLWAPERESSPLADAWTYTCAVVDWPSVAEGLAEDIPSTVDGPAEPDDDLDDA